VILGLGTAQFGSVYGITNTRGKVPSAEIVAVLDLAPDGAVIDTAPGYGKSEEILGRLLPRRRRFKIVTKTETGPAAGGAPDLRKNFLRSLRRLRQKNVYALLAHRAADVCGEPGAERMGAMRALKKEGLVRKIGVSVYDAREIDAVLSEHDVDLIQLPLNVFDRRLAESGHLVKLHRKGIEIHARSVFLQGVLLGTAADARRWFGDRFGKHFAAYEARLHELNFSKLDAAVSFVRGRKEISAVIFGVSSLAEWRKISTAFRRRGKVRVPDFSYSDAHVLNPALWKKKA
jgi:aryl-alcohol dehydrogenase-like predicted oxidoreductase